MHKRLDNETKWSVSNLPESILTNFHGGLYPTHEHMNTLFLDPITAHGMFMKISANKGRKKIRVWWKTHGRPVYKFLPLSGHKRRSWHGN